jgi:hypothetical protein
MNKNLNFKFMLGSLLVILVFTFTACTTGPIDSYEQDNINNVETPLLDNEKNIDDSQLDETLSVENTENNNVELVENFSGVSIANWNLQIFGKSKASDNNLLNFYVDVIDEFDIVFIQEIRDISETSFPKLCDKLSGYSCKVSSRAGRSSSKEQYGVIYKTGINIIEFKDFNPDKLDRWERPPIMVKFDISGYEVSIYNIHTKPDDVQNEMSNLEDIVVDEGNVVIFGDLNADCSYYNNLKETEFDSWNWIIKDNEDTTVSQTDCAYDRIILNDNSNLEFSNYGILSEGINKEVSDHYLVWFNLGINDFEMNVSIMNISNQVIEDIVEENITIVSDIIKKSSTGICHDISSSYYERTEKYTGYNTIDDCLNSGGRLPK